MSGPKLGRLLDDLARLQELEFRIKGIVRAYAKGEGQGPDAMIAMLDIGRAVGIRVRLMGYEAPSTPRNL